MTLTNIDLWIGKTLFVPPVIKLCQLTGQSQFAVSRMFWFIAALDGFYRADTLVSAVIFGGMSVIMMLTASLRADMPTSSSVWFRMLALGFFVLDLMQGARTGKWLGTEFWIFVLIAECRDNPDHPAPRSEDSSQGGPGKIDLKGSGALSGKREAV